MILLKSNKISNVIWAIIYIVFFNYVWKFYCVPIWHVFNYKNVEHTLAYDLLGYGIALVPIFFYRGLKAASSPMLLVIYLFGYIPVVLSLLYNFPEASDTPVLVYWVILSVAMSFFFYSEKIVLRLKKSKHNLSLNYMWFLVGALVVMQLVLYGRNMRIVGFDDIYTLREENSKVGGGLFAYLSSWSDTFFYPFLFAYGLLKKNRTLIIIGTLLFVFLYSIFGSKLNLFTPLILVLYYLGLKWSERTRINVIALITLFSVLLAYLMLSNLENDTVYLLSSVVFMRTYTISGCLFSGYYVPFFENNMHTYFSHINIVNAVTNLYPYGDVALGKVVTNGGMNANAIFWAMDGVAGNGVIGVAIVSIFFGLFVIMLNSVASGHNRIFVSLMMLVPTMSLLNTSFFTFLLSEGVFLVLLFLFLYSPNKRVKFF